LILTGNEIKKRMGNDIVIHTFDEKRINSNSYNLRLGKKLKVYYGQFLDMKKENNCMDVTIPEEGLIIWPGRLYLGQTMEYTETYNLVPILEGRSSIGRLGINIHATAGFGDIGFCGWWTLEISCVQPVKIYPKVEICQIYYETVLGKIENYKSNKYQNNHGVQASKLYKEFK